MAEIGTKWAGSTPSFARKLAELGADPVEDLLAVVDQVHLVHRDDDLLEPEEREEEAVAAGLLAQAFLGVDQEDGGVGAGGAGDHVLEEFLVARGVDDRERAAFRAEVNLGRVHRDVLRLLLQQGVEQEGVFEFHSLRLAGGLDLLGLAVGQGVGVEEKPADQGGLAMVDVADDHELQMVRAGRRGGGGGGRRPRGRGRGGSGGFGQGVNHRGHMNPLARSFCMALRS